MKRTKTIRRICKFIKEGCYWTTISYIYLYPPSHVLHSLQSAIRIRNRKNYPHWHGLRIWTPVAHHRNATSLPQVKMKSASILVLLVVALKCVAAFRPAHTEVFSVKIAHKQVQKGHKWVSAMLIGSLLSFGFMDNAFAADAKAPLLVYKSGKSPTGPNKNDPKQGTKKEPSFLRCVSNCKSDCQKPGEGLAKNDCVADCQDQCCSSYEQCSFKIKSSAGNSI